MAVVLSRNELGKLCDANTLDLTWPMITSVSLSWQQCAVPGTWSSRLLGAFTLPAVHCTAGSCSGSSRAWHSPPIPSYTLAHTHKYRVTKANHSSGGSHTAVHISCDATSLQVSWKFQPCRTVLAGRTEAPRTKHMQYAACMWSCRCMDTFANNCLVRTCSQPLLWLQQLSTAAAINPADQAEL